MTGEQIIEKLQELENTPKSGYNGYDDFSELPYFSTREGLIRDTFGNVRQVEHYGGEGDGSTYYTVLHFIDHDVYVRLDGYYTSYSGVDYSYSGGYKLVKPVEKIVTVFE